MHQPASDTPLHRAVDEAATHESLKLSQRYHLSRNAGSLNVQVERQMVKLGGLRTFIKLAWHTVEGGTPYSSNWHIHAICDHLEAVSRGEIKRLIIAVPPRSMKSVSTAVMWPAWDWIEHPERRLLFSSYAAKGNHRDLE